jgi:hypothetical protein
MHFAASFLPQKCPFKRGCILNLNTAYIIYKWGCRPHNTGVPRAAWGFDTHVVEDVALNKKKSNWAHEGINIYAIRIFYIC